jgi:hypothetical protein
MAWVGLKIWVSLVGEGRNTKGKSSKNTTKHKNELAQKMALQVYYLWMCPLKIK